MTYTYTCTDNHVWMYSSPDVSLVQRVWKLNTSCVSVHWLNSFKMSHRHHSEQRHISKNQFCPSCSFMWCVILFSLCFWQYWIIKLHWWSLNIRACTLVQYILCIVLTLAQSSYACDGSDFTIIESLWPKWGGVRNIGGVKTLILLTSANRCRASYLFFKEVSSILTTSFSLCNLWTSALSRSFSVSNSSFWDMRFSRQLAA